MKQNGAIVEQRKETWTEFLWSINWRFVIHTFSIYILGFIGLYHAFTFKAKFFTYLWDYGIFLLGGTGLGLGSHRYFSHRSFKVTRGYKIFLLICQAISGVYSVLFWVRIHRVHHKYADTERDPTNIKNGFLFTQFYWPFRFNKACKKAMDDLDVTDVYEDKDIMFHTRNYFSMLLIFCVILPTILPCLLWNESLENAFWLNMFRWLMNFTQFNFAGSLMHYIGTKPYDKNITATEHIFNILFTFGEGYHNYHHVFPWDYRGSEVGDSLLFNFITVFLDFGAKFGFVYDRKTVSPQMIERRVKRTGDGSHYLCFESSRKYAVWGYGDKDMDEEDKKELDAQNELNNN